MKRVCEEGSPEAEIGETFGKPYPRSLLTAGVLSPSAAWLTSDPTGGLAIDYYLHCQPSGQQRFSWMVSIQKVLRRKEMNVYLGFRSSGSNYKP